MHVPRGKSNTKPPQAKRTPPKRARKAKLRPTTTTETKRRRERRVDISVARSTAAVPRGRAAEKPPEPPCPARYVEGDGGRRYGLDAVPPGCAAARFYKRANSEPASLSNTLAFALSDEQAPDEDLCMLARAVALACHRRHAGSLTTADKSTLYVLAKKALLFVQTATEEEWELVRALSPQKSRSTRDPVRRHQILAWLKRMRSCAEDREWRGLAELAYTAACTMGFACAGDSHDRDEKIDEIVSCLEARPADGKPGDPETAMVEALEAAGMVPHGRTRPAWDLVRTGPRQ
jgi:hypothetical protein